MNFKGGIYAAQLVPYAADGSVKEKELIAMVERNIVVGGVDGLYIGGSTGENFLNDTRAKTRVLEIAASVAKGRVSLIAQIGSLNMVEAEGLARQASKLGYDAVSAVTPYYYKFSFAETREYYVRLAEAAGLPMLVYTIPALTGSSFDMEQLHQLYRHPLVAGFKYTSGDLFTMERLISSVPDRVVFSGYDELLLFGRAIGAYGAIGSTYNLFAAHARKIWDAVEAGRLPEARTLQAGLNGAIQEILAIGIYPCLKELVSFLSGIDVGHPLPPFAPLSAEGKEKARKLGKDLVARGLLAQA